MTPTMESGRLRRVLRLVTLLQGGVPFTAGEPAAQLRISHRTLFRDVNTIEATEFLCLHGR